MEYDTDKDQLVLKGRDSIVLVLGALGAMCGSWEICAEDTLALSFDEAKIAVAALMQQGIDMMAHNEDVAHLLREQIDDIGAMVFGGHRLATMEQPVGS